MWPVTAARDLRDRLPALIGDIYETALDPSRWPGVVEALGTAFRGSGVLLMQDSRRPDATVFAASGIDSAHVQRYVDHYAATNLWIPRLAALPAVSVVTSDDIVPREIFDRSEWYNDWLRPAGLYHGVGCVLDNTDAVVTQFSVLRPRDAGDYDVEELALLRIVSEHLQRALRVHRELTASNLQRDAAMAGLERLATAALVVDAAGRVLFANGVALALLSAGDELAEIDGRVHTRTPAVTDRLHHLIAQAVGTATLRKLHPGGVLPLPRRGRRPALALVSPLRGDALALARLPPAALILVRDPERVAAADLAVLRSLYGLTRTEAQTAGALAEGKRPDEIAVATGTSIHTVRTHMRNAMRKLGTRRQSEFVAIVLGSSGGLVGV